MKMLDPQAIFLDAHPLGEDAEGNFLDLPCLQDARRGDIVGVRMMAWHIKGQIQVDCPCLLLADGPDFPYSTITINDFLDTLYKPLTDNHRAGLKTITTALNGNYHKVLQTQPQWGASLKDGEGYQMRSINIFCDSMMVVDDVHQYFDELDEKDAVERSRLFIVKPPSRHAEIAMSAQMETLRSLYEALSIRDAEWIGKIGYLPIQPT